MVIYCWEFLACIGVRENGGPYFAARCNILLRADSSSVFVMWFPDPDDEL